MNSHAGKLGEHTVQNATPTPLQQQLPILLQPRTIPVSPLVFLSLLDFRRLVEGPVHHLPR